MLQELLDYIHNLPSARQNNSRDIMRQKFNWIMKQNPQTAVSILQRDYGIELNWDNPYDVMEPNL